MRKERVKKLISVLIVSVLFISNIMLNIKEVKAVPVVVGGTSIAEYLAVLLASAGLTFENEQRGKSAAESFYNSLSTSEKAEFRLMQNASATDTAIALTTVQLKKYYGKIKDYFSNDNETGYKYDLSSSNMVYPDKIPTIYDIYNGLSQSSIDNILGKDVKISDFDTSGTYTEEVVISGEAPNAGVVSAISGTGISLSTIAKAKSINGKGYIFNKYGHYIDVVAQNWSDMATYSIFRYGITIFNNKGQVIMSYSCIANGTGLLFPTGKIATQEVEAYAIVIPQPIEDNIGSYSIKIAALRSCTYVDTNSKVKTKYEYGLFNEAANEKVYFPITAITSVIPLAPENVFSSPTYPDVVVNGLADGGYVGENDDVYIPKPSIPWWKGIDEPIDAFVKPEVFVPETEIDIETGEPKVPSVEVPIGDVAPTGFFGTLLDWLNNFWEKLRDMLDRLSLTFAGTLVGTASLDFSKFNKDINFISIFPFCIPFDFVNAIKSLNVAPKTPSWVIDFSGTVLGDSKITIDLGQFESLAKVIRFFVFMTFALGLMIGTRNFIKW